MIAAHLEPAGLAPDAEPIASFDSERNRRNDAMRGSQRLLDAMLRAGGHPVPANIEVAAPPPVPILVRPKPRKQKRPRGRPRGSVKARRIDVKIVRIQNVVARHFGLTVEAMMSPDRAYEVAHPRQLAMYLARVATAASLPEIGFHFGGRDHTTVLHGVRMVEQRIKTNHLPTIEALIVAHQAGL